MDPVSRRRLIQAGAGAAAIATVGATPRFATAAAAAQEDVTIAWWDHYAPLEALLNANFEAYSAANPGVTVERTLYNLPELGQSLQLAFNSDQAPDVHAIASLNVPTARLVADGWFTPIDSHVSPEFRGRFPEGSLIEGIHIFDGQLYSFPMFSFRSHSTLLWFNKSLVEDAGIDPAVGPKTWDEFRTAAKAITDNGGGRAYGWIQAIQLAERLGTQVNELAQAAGGTGTTNPLTGEYTYHSDEVLQAIELLKSINDDGALFPGSTSLDPRTARARFTTGVAGFNFDGPWSIGVISNEYSDFLDTIGVAQIPTPAADTAGYVRKGPNGGDFWVSSQSEHADIAAGILEGFNTPEFYVGLAERMDQPPLDLTAADSANVHETYARALGLFAENCRLGPVPEIGNPAVSDVLAKMTDIRPNFGEIVQGVFSGDTADPATALKEYSDKMTAERDRAIAEVAATGATVSVDDWVFPAWDPAQDFTSESYT
jgi:multiple sugar transport system substrate-binding protein